MSFDAMRDAVLSETSTVISSDTFCIVPFIHYSTTTVGDFKLCCRSDKIGNIDNTSIKDLWNSELYGNVRSDLVQGIRIPQCSACWKLEDNNIQSLRQSHNAERGFKYRDRVIEWVQTGTLPWSVPIVELKLSNICNLRCRMCWPKDSTPWLKDWDKVKEFYSDGDQQHIDDIIATYNLNNNPIINRFESNPSFLENFLSAADHIEELEFAGGEPLLDPLHLKIIDRLPNPGSVILKYNTNLTKLNFNRKISILEIWKRFKGIKLTISIDGGPDLNAHIRKNSDWTDIVENLRTVHSELGEKLLESKVTTCISAMNALSLDDTITHIMRDFNAHWITTRLQYPDFLHANVLPVDELRSAINQLSQVDVTASPHRINHEKQIQNCINWLQHCIDENTHSKNHKRYLEFSARLPE